MSARFLVNFCMDFGWRNLGQSNPYRGKRPFLVFQIYWIFHRFLDWLGFTCDRSIYKSIPLENQKRPYSSIGVALPQIPPCAIDAKINEKSRRHRCPWKTKNSDFVREGVAKSVKKPSKNLSQPFRTISNKFHDQFWIDFVSVGGQSCLWLIFDWFCDPLSYKIAVFGFPRARCRRDFWSIFAWILDGGI